MTRVPELPPELDDRQKAVFEQVRAGPRGRVRGPLALWLYSPDLAERAQVLGEFLRFGTSFEKRLSELAIITVARHFDCDYVWAIHAPIAAQAGVDPAAIEAIRTRRRPSLQSGDEALVHGFVSELLETHRVSEQGFAGVLERFGERGVVELTGIMGYYAMGAFLSGAVELDTPDGSRPFVST